MNQCAQDQLERAGFTLGTKALSDDLIKAVIARMAPVLQQRAKPVARITERQFPEIRGLLDAPLVRTAAHTLFGTQGSVVKVQLFDKTPEQNWAIPWHQDTLIPISPADKTVEPHSNNSDTRILMKDGTPHREATPAELSRTLTLRFHLDDAGENNGALRVLPGTHKMGRLKQPEIMALADEMDAFICTASRGDVLMMRPLLVHQSHRSTSPLPRRVIHIELAA